MTKKFDTGNWGDSLFKYAFGDADYQLNTSQIKQVRKALIESGAEAADIAIMTDAEILEIVNEEWECLKNVRTEEYYLIQKEKVAESMKPIGGKSDGESGV